VGEKTVLTLPQLLADGVFCTSNAMGAPTLRRRKKRDISAAEVDLRLLSEKASRSFKVSKFDLFLAKYHLVTPWVFLLMMVSYGLQVGALVLEELSDFSVRIRSQRLLEQGAAMDNSILGPHANFHS
jgi:hypothetical protein